jgi:hypothetical protein
VNRYTPEQIQFLKNNVKGRSFSGLLDLFNKRFGLSISLKTLRGVCSYYELRNCVFHRHYTPEEICFVRKNIRGRSYIEMTKLFNKRFGLRITLKQMETLTYKHGIRNGIGTINGFAPPNKGKKHKPWIGNYRPIGTERIIAGYVEVKTSHNYWDRKHTAIWKAAYGKVPKGYVVIFADRDNRNFALDNLLLVSRKELAVMNRNGLISTRKDLTAAGKTIADIKLMITKRTCLAKKRKKA